MIKLDYSLQTPEERKDLVQRYIDEAEAEGRTIPDSYLETLADYIIFCMEKQEKKQRKLLTSNRMVTVNKHETSYEGLIETFEQGEDHIYNIIEPQGGNKHTFLIPRVSITAKDIEEVPHLKQLHEAIKSLERQLPQAQGRAAYIIKQTLIDLRKDQYVLKDSYRQPIVFKNITHSKAPLYLPSREYIDANGDVASTGISFTNPTVVALVLQNYSRLCEDGWGDFYDDTYFMMLDFDNLLKRSLEAGSIYERIAMLKIDSVSNLDIQKDLEQNFGVSYSPEYISSLWRHKIPRQIAQTAADDYLIWHYTYQERGKWKRCSRCGQVKLAHHRFFTRNASSRDGFYSICKECRRGQN